MIELMFNASHDDTWIKCDRATESRSFEVQTQAWIIISFTLFSLYCFTYSTRSIVESHQFQNKPFFSLIQIECAEYEVESCQFLHSGFLFCSTNGLSLLLQNSNHFRYRWNNCLWQFSVGTRYRHLNMPNRSVQRRTAIRGQLTNVCQWTVQHVWLQLWYGLHRWQWWWCCWSFPKEIRLACVKCATILGSDNIYPWIKSSSQFNSPFFNESVFVE